MDMSINYLDFYGHFPYNKSNQINSLWKGGNIIMENKGRKIYYARVSSKDQNLARQIELFKSLGATDDDIVTDKKSGKNFDRESYQALKNPTLGLRKGDTLVIKELDRLGRNKEQIKEELEYWKEKGVRVMVYDIPTTMIDIDDDKSAQWIFEMVSNILIEVLSTMAEQERLKTQTRREEGVAVMKVGKDGKRYSLKTGRPVGRPNAKFPENWDQYYIKWKNGDITAKSMMEELGLKKSTFYNLVKIYDNAAE